MAWFSKQSSYKWLKRLQREREREITSHKALLNSIASSLILKNSDEISQEPKVGDDNERAEVGVGNAEFGVANAGEVGVGNAEFGVANAGEVGVGNAEFGVGNAEFGVGNAEVGVGMSEVGVDMSEVGVGNAGVGKTEEEWIDMNLEDIQLEDVKDLSCMLDFSSLHNLLGDHDISPENLLTSIHSSISWIMNLIGDGLP